MQTVHLFIEIRYVTLQVEAEYHFLNSMQTPPWNKLTAQIIYYKRLSISFPFYL